MVNLKQIVHGLINGALLSPFGLRLSFRAGSYPIEDMVSLLRGRSVAVIIDGGAYAGSFSRDIAKAFPSSTIHAFEPTPTSHALLEKNTRGVDAIVRHQLALGAKGGMAKFYENASPLTNSLRNTSVSGRRYFSRLVADRAETAVEVVTLADFAVTNGLETIDILKLDLQGNELEAIIGLGALINTVQVVFTEVQFVSLYDCAPLFAEIESHLRGKGLALYQLYELVRDPDDGRLLYGDAMFVRPEFLSGT